MPRVSVVVAVLLLSACSGQPTAPRPSPTAAARTSLPMSTPSSPAMTHNLLSLAAIQRLDPQVGFVAGWTGTGVGLARTTDAGMTWQTLAMPASHASWLRFVDANVGWAAGFVLRDVPQVACQQAAPAGASPCYGVVLRTVDGGSTWERVLAIPTDGVRGEPVVQLQAVDGEVAWVLTLACTMPPVPASLLNCPTDLRRTTDGGRTWQTLLHGAIVAIRFATASRGWLALASADGSFD